MAKTTAPTKATKTKKATASVKPEVTNAEVAAPAVVPVATSAVTTEAVPAPVQPENVQAQPETREVAEKLEEKVLLIKRVSKKTSGGNYVTFSALVVVGDGKGKVGIGVGRGLEVPPAIQKAILKAKKSMVEVPLVKATIPHQISVKYKSARLFFKPAPEGTGLKVGSVARIIFDLAGIHDASGKIIGTRNQVVNTYAVMEALKRLKKKNI